MRERSTIALVARLLSDLLLALDEVVALDAARSAQARVGAAGAQAIAPDLAWVHRTGKDDWRSVFDARRLAAKKSCTRFEIDLGLAVAVYFFVGACAYPQGIVALLVSPRAAASGPSTFSPYDTGGLKSALHPADSSVPWDDAAKARHLAAHLGHADDVVGFLGPYLAAHFRDPVDYVRRAQASQPDFTPYHGLVSGDRRDWTIESRVHADVEIAPDGLILEEIWLTDQDLWDELPDDFKRLARVAPEGQRLEVAVARRIEERLRRGQA